MIKIETKSLIFLCTSLNINTKMKVEEIDELNIVGDNNTFLRSVLRRYRSGCFRPSDPFQLTLLEQCNNSFLRKCAIHSVLYIYRILDSRLYTLHCTSIVQCKHIGKIFGTVYNVSDWNCSESSTLSAINELCYFRTVKIFYIYSLINGIKSITKMRSDHSNEYLEI